MIPSYLNFNIKKIGEKLLPSNKRVANLQAWLNALLDPMVWLYSLWRFDYLEGEDYADWNNVDAYSEGDRVVYKYGTYEAKEANTDVRPTNRAYWLPLNGSFIGVYDRSTYTAQKMSLEYYLNRWFSNLGATSLIYIEHNENKINQTALYNEIEGRPLYLFNEPEVLVFNITTQYFKGDIVNDNGVIFYCIKDSLGNDTTNLQFWIIYSYFFNEEAFYQQNDFTVYVPLALYNTMGDNDTQRDASVSAQVDKYNYFGVIYTIETY